MDLLGKQGEKAEEELKQVKGRVDKLSSHIDAVDSSLQDFQSEITHVLEDELKHQRHQVQQLNSAVDEQEDQQRDMEIFEKELNSLESRMNSLETNVESFLESDIHDSLSEMIKGVRSTQRFMHSLEDRISELEGKMEDLESQFITEVNNRDYDFEKKLDKRDYNEEKEYLEEEIKKLRASVNSIAEEMDGDIEIKVE